MPGSLRLEQRTGGEEIISYFGQPCRGSAEGYERQIPGGGRNYRDLGTGGSVAGAHCHFHSQLGAKAWNYPKDGVLIGERLQPQSNF